MPALTSAPRVSRFARRGLHLAVFATAGTAAVVACSSSGGGSSGGSAAPAPTTAAPAPASSAPAASAPAAGGGTTVVATETEFMIMLSNSNLKAGTYTFSAQNKGAATHALEIDGPGVEDMSTGDLAPGASKNLTVTLQKGSYEIYCPVANHKSMGMDLHVTVS